MSKTKPTYTALAETLAAGGVRHVFGVLGHGNLLLMHDLVRSHGVEHVAVNREDAAVGAADAYARVSGALGVAAVTHGPGLTNTITTLHEACRARTPLLLLVGDTAVADRTHEQDIDQRATVAPTGAGFVQMRSTESALEDLRLAVHEAWLERRPVVFNMPVDLQDADGRRVPVDIQPPRPGRIAPDPEALDKALGVLAVARRPVVVAGRGAVDAAARDRLVRLAELLRAPLATTLLARGLFEDHPFNLGVFGTLSSPPAVDAIGKADCIVAFGASLNRYTTSYGNFLSNKHVIQVDHELREIGRWHRVDVGVVGDAEATATLMADSLEELAEPPPGLRSPDLQERLAEHDRSREFTDASTDHTIDPRTLMIWLDQNLPADRTVVTDVGGYLRTALRYLDVSDPRATVVPGNFGSIGLGMGAATGAAVANRHRPTTAVVGDGGFMMGGIGEFETAVRHRLDLIVVVMSNGGYEIERRVLKDRGCDPTIANMGWPRLEKVAQALGGEGTTVRSLDDLGHAESMIINRRVPLLIDAQISSIA